MKVLSSERSSFGTFPKIWVRSIKTVFLVRPQIVNKKYQNSLEHSLRVFGVLEKVLLYFA